MERISKSFDTDSRESVFRQRCIGVKVNQIRAQKFVAVCQMKYIEFSNAFNHETVAGHANMLTVAGHAI